MQEGVPVFCISCGKYMKRDMTESLTEEGEGRIFQWSRIKSVKMSKKELKFCLKSKKRMEVWKQVVL